MTSPWLKKIHQSCPHMKVLLIFFFIRRTSFIMSLVHTVRQSVRVSWDICERQYEERDHRHGQTEPGYCITHCSCTHPKNTQLLLFHSHAALQIWPLQKSILKGCQFQTTEEIQENLQWRVCYPRNRVPGHIKKLENTLGAVYQQWRELFQRKQVWLICK